MAVLALLVLVAVGVSLALARARRTEAFRIAPVSESAAAALRGANGASRMRALAAITASAVAFAFFFALNEVRPDAFGLPLLLAPGAAAIVGLTVLGAIPPARMNTVTLSPRRSASLAPRRPWSFGPPWAYLIPLTAAVSAAIFTTLAGMSSTVADDGTYRAIRVSLGDATSTSTPYPGWYYGVPLLIMTALLTAATLFALARIASAPAPADEALTEADRILRIASTRVVMKVSSGALFAYFGGALFFAGQATRNAATFLTGTSATVVQPEGVVGTVEVVAGTGGLILGAVLLCLAAIDAVRAPVVAVIPRDGSTAGTGAGHAA
ncbi:hypothetical protein [Planctomonas psychrotolerans]|uniref:hypothetical protein n=1 Tax=Planctomonas psychrotolerans TaxID=2528712 RepID=UPI00123BDF9E|nr:hypothetical protein [Planctomonas psychrotolerans]